MSQPQRSRMVELASDIAKKTAVLEDYYHQSGLPYPGLEDGSSTWSALPDHLQAVRLHMIEAVTELQELLCQPAELVMHHHEHPFWMYDVIGRFNIAANVPLDQDISYAQLATNTSLAEPTLKSILRYAMLYRVFAERTPNRISHTPASRLLATEPTILEHTGFVLDEVIKPALYSGEALQRWPRSTNPAETAFMLGERSSAPDYWAHIVQYPARLDRFTKIMAQGIDVDAGTISNNFAWAEYKTVVELGGSQGELAVRLLKQYPHLDITVQDLPEVIALAGRNGLEEAKHGVKLMAHNFFDEQPVREAGVYLFRHCFHDWNDEACIRILRALIPALRKDARVLIVDAILPPPGELPRLLERRLRTIDNNMRHALNSKERELEEWKQLFTTADKRFRFIRAIPQPLGTQCGLIELAWDP